MKRIGILGAGTWGMALARMLTVSGNDVLVWSAIEKEIDDLSTTRVHPNLPGMKIPRELKFTKSESLDGGQRTFNLQVSYGARVEIEVELGEVSQRQTVKADKAKTVRMNFNDKTDTTVPDGTD